MKNTPKLRFPEFSGEWQEKKLGTLLEFKNGINASKEQYGKGVKFINVLDILSNNYIKYDNIIGKVDIDGVTLEKYSVSYGDILFQRSSETRKEVGTANVYLDKEKKATFGGFVIRGKKIGEYDPVFINNLLKTPFARKDITTKSGGSTRYNVGQEILSEVELLFPYIAEQEKIASFLSLIDEKIEKQQNKVEALEAYKKGMMKKIFSREIKFKKENGEEYPEWEEKEFGEFLSSRIQKQIPSQEAPLMAFTATGGIEPKGDKYDRSFLVKSEEKLYKRTELNDFIYSSNNLDVGSIGLNKYGTAVISDVYEIFTVSKEASYNFISELIKTPKVMSKVISYRQGVMYGQYRIHVEDFLKIKEFIPCLKEQYKIDNFLSKLDEKLGKEQEKLQALNQWKKGLLKQMFV